MTLTKPARFSLPFADPTARSVAAPAGAETRTSYWSRTLPIAPLVTFRVLFGLLMCYGALRFMAAGWVEALYVAPQFFFKFYGFHWVQPLGRVGSYLLYSLIAVSSLALALGYRYRLAAVLFFPSFTYSELLDATNYLNHYYLVCLLALLLIFIPAHGAASLDVRQGRTRHRSRVPAWCIHALMLQIGIVYFYAGLAKVDADWLLRAMPLAVWLPTKADWPVLGVLFAQPWMAYVFSWAGAIYDLTIVGWLRWSKSRPWAYAAVVVFHVLTKLLFNIGLFPLIMITSTLIFFSAGWHERLHERLRRLAWLQSDRLLPTKVRWVRGLDGITPACTAQSGRRQPDKATSHALHPAPGLISGDGIEGFSGGFDGITRQPDKATFPPIFTRYALLTFFAFQLLFPLRYLAYPGPVQWTEEGYRFGWRVMLVEKAGQATFYVADPATGRRSEIRNLDYLTPFQEKQMAIQPDFILQYAHFLARTYREQYGIANPRVTVDSYVALNGRPSRRFIDPEVNLAMQQDTWQPKPWILTFEE